MTYTQYAKGKELCLFLALPLFGGLSSILRKPYC